MATRKTSLLQLICLSSILYCHAGTGGSFSIGADAGPGLSALYGPSSNLIDFRQVQPSVLAGINFRYNFPKIVSICSGIYYCQFGYNYQVNIVPNIFPSPPTIASGSFNTFNIPLLARVSFGKKIVFFAEAGPFLNIIVKNTVAFWDLYNQFYPPKTITAGITAGAGIEVPLPHRFALSFEVRSNVGLDDIAGGAFDGNNEIKTCSTTLLCGFSYTLPVITNKLKTQNRK